MIRVIPKHVIVITCAVIGIGTGLQIGGSIIKSEERNAVRRQTSLQNGSQRRASEGANKFGQDLLGKGVPGLEIAVSKNGKFCYSESFGCADIQSHTPVTRMTKFRIGSVSKTITATALVQLKEQGKLTLDAPIQRYVPSFPEKGALITPRMLAGHLGGLRHYTGTERSNQHHFSFIADGLAIFKNDSLVSPPGVQFHYSSYGFNLLGVIIEAASGQSFYSFVDGNICRPLQLRSTMPDQPGGLINQRAQCYFLGPGKQLHVVPYLDNTFKLPSGGFVSSAEDLASFGSALVRPGFLTADSLCQLFTPQKAQDGKSTGYGMGWCVGKSRTSQVIYWHSGDAGGGSSVLIVYPQARLAIAVVANLSDAPFALQEVESIAEEFETAEQDANLGPSK